MGSPHGLPPAPQPEERSGSRAHLLAQEQPPGHTGVGEAHAGRGHEQLGADPLVPHGLHPAWQREGPGAPGMTGARGEKTPTCLGPFKARLAQPPLLTPTRPHLLPPPPASGFPCCP